MKFTKALLLVLALVACARDNGYLGLIPPSNKTQSDDPNKQEPDPYHATRTYEMMSDVVGEVSAPVDVVWVIDNSGSMREEQLAVVDNTATFIKNFTQNKTLQWKMGLISTTRGAAPYIGFEASKPLDYTTANPVKKFQDAVNALGINGSQLEEAFNPLLDNFAKYPNFLRSDAYLALIFVTDEEEGSWETNNRMLSVSKFVSQLVALKNGDASKLLTYGIFGNKEDCSDGAFSYSGSRWREFIVATGGRRFRTCGNWGSTIANLGEDLVRSITAPHPQVLIDVEVDPATLKVFYAGRQLRPGTKAQGGEWVYDPIYHVLEITDPSILTNANKTITIEFDFKPH